MMPKITAVQPPWCVRSSLVAGLAVPVRRADRLLHALQQVRYLHRLRQHADQVAVVDILKCAVHDRAGHNDDRQVRHLRVVRDRVQQRPPIHARQADVEQGDCWHDLAQQFQRLLGALRLDHPVAPGGQVYTDKLADVHFIFDNPYRFFPHSTTFIWLLSSGISSVSLIGNEKATVVPGPARFSIQILPLCASTSPRAIASPSPAPFVWLLFWLAAWRKASKTRSRSSGGMPGPSSITRMQTCVFSCRASMRMGVCGGA